LDPKAGQIRVSATRGHNVESGQSSRLSMKDHEKERIREMCSQKSRTEYDSLGSVEVSDDRLWGAQTERSLKNFDISSERMPKELGSLHFTVNIGLQPPPGKQIQLSPSFTQTARRFSLEGCKLTLTLESIPSSVQPLPRKPKPLSLLTRNASGAIGMFLASIPRPWPSPSTNSAMLNPLPCISWWSRFTKRSRRCGRNDSNAPVGSGEGS
jgi:hypothetical protein